MPVNPPISHNSNDDNDHQITATLHPAPTLRRKKPALETNRDIADPITPTEIILTPRQQRVLRYLARRRMRNARIIKRYDNAVEETSLNAETRPAHLAPGPAVGTKTNHQGAAPVPITPLPANEPIEAPVPAPIHTTPIPEPIDEPGEAEQSLIDVPSVSTQALHTT